MQLVLNGDLPDRIPFNFWMDRDQMAAYDRIWGHDFRITHYGADVIEAFVMPQYWASRTPKTVSDAKTAWQIEPLVNSIDEALDLPLPDPADAAIYHDAQDKRARHPDKAIFALMLAPLDVLLQLRLMQNLCLDLVDNSEQVHRLLRRIQTVMMEAARRACALDIDVLYLAGDICDRNGPMLSPRHLREFLFDYLVDVIDAAHAAGKKVFYHTDGNVTQILDLFVAYSIDGINPLEARYHDSRDFVRRTGGRLMLYGGLDNCGVIPNGSTSDVREHVWRQFEVLGRSGRLIMSSHDIPGCCPMENMDAMVEAIKSCTY